MAWHSSCVSSESVSSVKFQSTTCHFICWWQSGWSSALCRRNQSKIREGFKKKMSACPPPLSGKKIKKIVLCCLILLWFHRQWAELHPDCHQQINWQVAVWNFTELTNSELTQAVPCHLAKITHSWPALGSSNSHASSFSSAYCQNPNDSITQPQLELSWTWKWHANHSTTHHHTNS